MIESMTGFGRGSSAMGDADVAAEVRSVNGRYVEVSVRAPRELGPYELEVQKRVRTELSRGKVTVAIQVERSTGVVALNINEAAAIAYANLLERLRFITGIREPIRLNELLSFKDIFVGEEAVTAPPESLWQAASEALAKALKACQAMRREEGLALAKDLEARLACIESALAEIDELAPERIVSAREVLRSRLADLLGEDHSVDPGRLETEVAILADRLDVNEESVRLRSHIAQFRSALSAAEPVGRRLNFLAQELNREINTISSKANDSAIAHLAVTMKEELEKMREQIQNVA